MEKKRIMEEEEEDDFSPAAYLKAKRQEEVRLASADHSDDKELTQIEKEHSELEKDALCSTEKTLETLQQTEAVANKASDQLHLQGAILDEAEAKLKKVDANADENYKAAKKVKKHGHFLAFIFGRRAKVKGQIDKEYMEKQTEIEHKKSEHQLGTAIGAHDSQRAAEKGKEADGLTTAAAAEDFSSRAQADDPLQPSSDRVYRNETEQKIDENLEDIESAVDRLKVIGTQMGNEMDRQALTMDSIDATGKHTQTTLERAQEKIQRYAV